ncbi:MAG TPA: hypothetical protein VKZ96_12215, partial [Thermomicrobiales bacterium]|nr:hypothetical protein [Thermomicrobiales bacterium]
PVDAGQGNTTGSLAKLDPNGNVIWTGEVAGGILDRYVDLAIAPDGTLYLADSELRQILVYRSVAEN